MGKSRHGVKKHFMERGSRNKPIKGQGSRWQEEGQDWRKTVRQMPEDNG